MSEYIPLILSTIVSLAAIGTTIYQSIVTKKIKTEELFFTAQLEAYQNLFREIAKQEYICRPPHVRNLNPFIKAAQNAMLVSTQRNADFISHFGAVFREYLAESDAGQLTDKTRNEFYEVRQLLTFELRQEIFRFDTMKRKSDKIYKKLKKDKQKNKKNQ